MERESSQPSKLVSTAVNHAREAAAQIATTIEYLREPRATAHGLVPVFFLCFPGWEGLRRSPQLLGMDPASLIAVLDAERQEIEAVVSELLDTRLDADARVALSRRILRAIESSRGSGTKRARMLLFEMLYSALHDLPRIGSGVRSRSDARCIDPVDYVVALVELHVPGLRPVLDRPEVLALVRRALETLPQGPGRGAGEDSKPSKWRVLAELVSVLALHRGKYSAATASREWCASAKRFSRGATARRKLIADLLAEVAARRDAAPTEPRASATTIRPRV